MIITFVADRGLGGQYDPDRVTVNMTWRDPVVLQIAEAKTLKSKLYGRVASGTAKVSPNGAFGVRELDGLPFVGEMKREMTLRESRKALEAAGITNIAVRVGRHGVWLEQMDTPLDQRSPSYHSVEEAVVAAIGGVRPKLHAKSREEQFEESQADLEWFTDKRP